MSHESIWNRWEEIDTLLEQVLDLPEIERDPFLVTACKDDQELIETMRALVRLSESGANRTLSPAGDLVRAALTERAGRAAPESLVGATVGPYRLVSVLGIGGMGAVYLGERMDGVFKRQVAVKILHAALNVADVLERFRIERQILASLSHGGIAQLIDGGATDDGRPFLVMEYVEGVPILRHAEERRLDVEDRIRLIVRVAEAVEYAHRHMVIHRDLKPSNILVTNDGQVKLLDFGIAKLLESPEHEAAPLATRPEVRYVTPEYAAPEQLLGQQVSTQTDVFSLAALLYELLTTVRPYASREPGSVLERMIRGDEPTAPSVVVATLPTAQQDMQVPRSAELPTTRSTGKDILRRRLSGDLDAILLRGLKTRPEERYSSVAALREDLERHLAGLPVVARGTAFLYRTHRFVRRHRVPVTLIVMAFLVAVGSAVGFAVQRGAVARERDRAEAAAAAASQEAETARQVTAFLISLFRGSDPNVARGDTLRVRTLLERGTARIERDLADQPAVRARLLEALGSVYLNLGVYESSSPLLQRAVALHRDSIPGSTHLARALVWLGFAHRVAREYRLAVATYHEAVIVARNASDERSLALAEWGLGATFVLTDQPDSAESALVSGLDRMKAFDDYPREDYLSALTSLAGLRRRKNDLPGAEALYREIAREQRNSHTTDPMDFAATLNNLAVVRRMQGAFEEARALYREAGDTVAAILGHGHPQSLNVQGNLAHTLFKMGRHDESISVYDARVAAARAQWPQGHWQIAETLMNLGGAFIDAGRPQQAIEPLTAAVEMAVAQIGYRHSWTNVYRGWLGTALALAGRQAQSAEPFRISLYGLSTYTGLKNDRIVISMIESLHQRMEERGLTERARQYKDLLGKDQ